MHGGLKVTHEEQLIDGGKKERLRELAVTLIDQHAAHVIVPPEREGPGHWFGSGNCAVGHDGALYLSGRYRNFGDSRTGVGKGERGKELALFRSTDEGANFDHVVSLSKADLGQAGCEVLSIEGSHLQFHRNGVTLYVSTEKAIDYPDPVADFHKPGTGVWTIDRVNAASIEALPQGTITPVVSSNTPEHLHVKDPFLFHAHEQPYLGYCTHPFTWASSNTAFSVNDRQYTGVFPRGPVWDVAMCRITCYAPVPRIGRFAEGERLYLCFYDGAECVRPLDEHPEAVKRPRGYSCEEIAGLAVAGESAPLAPERLSVWHAAFISPWGTGCSRYIDVLFTDEWAYATWQQSQPDQSQPLVMHAVPMKEVARILS